MRILLPPLRPPLPLTGQCIADVNVKAFALSFFWGGIYGLLIFPGGAANEIPGRFVR
jgi:hypothetical protein